MCICICKYPLYNETTPQTLWEDSSFIGATSRSAGLTSVSCLIACCERQNKPILNFTPNYSISWSARNLSTPNQQQSVARECGRSSYKFSGLALQCEEAWRTEKRDKIKTNPLRTLHEIVSVAFPAYQNEVSFKALRK